MNIIKKVASLILIQLLLIGCGDSGSTMNEIDKKFDEITSENHNNDKSDDGIQEEISENDENISDEQNINTEDTPKLKDEIFEEEPTIDVFDEIIIEEFNEIKITEIQNIIDIKQRLLSKGIYFGLDSVNNDRFKQELENIKQEYDDNLENGYIKDSTLEKFYNDTNHYFADTTHGYLMLTNKKKTLKYDYAPENIRTVTVSSTRSLMLDETSAIATEAMFEQAKKDGVNLILTSAYRDFDYQAGLFDRKVDSVGFENANKVVALPGNSEHQTGFVIDITSVSENYGLNESFDTTAEYKWLSENASDFGFILRYPKDKVDVTGYSYEPWHYRYVGNSEIAKIITENGITLEEYHEKYIN